MHCQQLHYWYSRDELSDRRIERFGSTPEAMGLKCPCGNAEGINDLASLAWPDSSSPRALSLAAYPLVLQGPCAN